LVSTPRQAFQELLAGVSDEPAALLAAARLTYERIGARPDLERLKSLTRF
jgi:hypothetical protein